MTCDVVELRGMGECPSSFRSRLSFITADEEETKRSCGRGGKDQKLHERPSSVRVLYAARYVPVSRNQRSQGRISISFVSDDALSVTSAWGTQTAIGGASIDYPGRYVPQGVLPLQLHTSSALISSAGGLELGLSPHSVGGVCVLIFSSVSVLWLSSSTSHRVSHTHGYRVVIHYSVTRHEETGCQS